jgi:hypothetical protein
MLVESEYDMNAAATIDEILIEEQTAGGLHSTSLH